jgi:hypothetical protein
MKQKPHTEMITSLLKRTLGEDADTGSLPVFEVIATSSRPLKKKGLYEGAVITPLTLAQMAQWVTNDPIPFMQDHNMEGTPKGKFFYAEMRQDTGTPELRGLFYLDPTETELIAKANSGTLDEVSVGFLPSSIKCSSCSFDYMAALRAGNYEPVMNRKCPSGHELGKLGVHAKVDGLEDFMELSAVSRGAAPNSKIIGNDNAKLGLDITKLAASGIDVNDLYITASASPQGEDSVDIGELVAQLSTAKADNIVTAGKLTAAEGQVTALNLRAETAEGSVATLTQTVADLTAELTAAKEAVAPTEDAAALTAAREYLGKEFSAVMALSGKPDAAVPEKVEDILVAINAHRDSLSALPIGGRSNDTRHTDAKPDGNLALSAFKTNKNK